MRSPGEDKSETGRSSPDGTCSSGEQGGIEPPVPPPRSTSIRITVEATTNRSGSSTTSSNESQPQVTSKFCVTDGKTPREKIRRGPILGRRRHTVDDNVINECRERDYDRDFADDFSSDIETSSDEGNETADDSFAASSSKHLLMNLTDCWLLKCVIETSSSPTGENLDLTGVVKGIRLSDEEKSATLKAVSTLNNNFPSLDLDPEPDADGVDHIYNSRFAFR